MERGVRPSAESLCLPHHFSQTFEDGVQCVVLAARRPQAPVVRDDAGGLVDCELLGDCKMKRQVQEWIDVAFLGPIVAIDVPIRRFEYPVIFRMQRDQLRRGLLEARQWLTGARLAPCLDEEMSCFVPGGREHRVGPLPFAGSQPARVRRRTAPEAGDGLSGNACVAGMPGNARVLAVYSQRSAMMHCGQRGTRAMHT